VLIAGFVTLALVDGFIFADFIGNGSSACAYSAADEGSFASSG
jgi:hypothetical protein